MEKEKNSPFPGSQNTVPSQSHPVSCNRAHNCAVRVRPFSSLTRWQTWHTSFFHTSQLISSQRGLATTRATARQDKASQSSGPSCQQPEVISAEAQRETAPTGW